MTEITFDVMTYLPKWHWQNILLVFQVAHVGLSTVYVSYRMFFAKKHSMPLQAPAMPNIVVHVNTKEEPASKPAGKGMLTCRACGTPSLHWENTQARGWRLFDDKGEHVCRK